MFRLQKFVCRQGTKTLQEVFSEIEKETEFIFFYNDNAIDLSRKVTVQKNSRFY